MWTVPSRAAHYPLMCVLLARHLWPRHEPPTGPYRLTCLNPIRESCILQVDDHSHCQELDQSDPLVPPPDHLISHHHTHHHLEDQAPEGQAEEEAEEEAAVDRPLDQDHRPTSLQIVASALLRQRLIAVTTPF